MLAKSHIYGVGPFGGVLGNLLGVIQQLGDAGIVGLLAAALLYKLLK